MPLHQRGFHPCWMMQTVYIKNLAADVTEPDLIGIFGRFETYGRPKLIYRLMQRGRMKGQAFVTFAGKCLAPIPIFLFKVSISENVTVKEPMVDSSSQTWKLQRRP